MSGLPCWQLKSGCILRWWQSGDEAVIYHLGSGDTHQLNNIAIVILEALQNGMLTTSELADKIAVKSEFESGDELLTAVESGLNELARLGLLESLQ